MSSTSAIKDRKFVRAMKEAPHLERYVLDLARRGLPVPVFYERVESSMKSLQSPNLIYPVGNQIFIHVNSSQATLKTSGGDDNNDGYANYTIVEPAMPDPHLLGEVDRLFSMEAGVIRPPEEYEKRLYLVDKFLEKSCTLSDAPVDYGKNTVQRGSWIRKIARKIPVYRGDFPSLRYHFIRRRLGSGLLEPFLTDPYLEDVSVAGAGNIYVVHKVFGSLRVPVSLSEEEIDDLIIGLSEQFGKTVSHARPVIDTTLPEGSRINVIFGRDISRKGTNATIRKFAKVPLSITQIISSKTLDSKEAAYLWMMLGEGMSVFICGETASGKTTTMTAISAFIPSTFKIVSIEDTPEISLPHPNWVNEITRDTGNPHSSVTMFDLLKAALRQRPNYILVGEIRGAEGNVAFQAMQTGHPVMSTFHAASVQSLIQRLTGIPISVPKTHIDNLNIALFQSAVQGKDGKMVRRVMTINEIIGYSGVTDNVLFIPVFNWDPATDAASYRGKGSSSLFLTKLLLRRGLSRKDEGLLYEELELRAKILERMVEQKIFDYFDVYHRITKVKEIGVEAYLNTVLNRT